MTQDNQETLNEIFLGKEDPDMAFKKPMTNNLKEEIREALDSFRGEIVDGYIDDRDLEEATQAILTLINQKEKEARLDELKNLMAQHSRTFTQKVTDSSGAEYVNESYLFISKYEAQERVEQLKEEYVQRTCRECGEVVKSLEEQEDHTSRHELKEELKGGKD